jgi:hypothetical protein
MVRVEEFRDGEEVEEMSYNTILAYTDKNKLLLSLHSYREKNSRRNY